MSRVTHDEAESGIWVALGRIKKEDFLISWSSVARALSNAAVSLLCSTPTCLFFLSLVVLQFQISFGLLFGMLMHPAPFHFPKAQCSFPEKQKRKTNNEKSSFGHRPSRRFCSIPIRTVWPCRTQDTVLAKQSLEPKNESGGTDPLFCFVVFEKKETHPYFFFSCLGLFFMGSIFLYVLFLGPSFPHALFSHKMHAFFPTRTTSKNCLSQKGEKRKEKEKEKEERKKNVSEETFSFFISSSQKNTPSTREDQNRSIHKHIHPFFSPSESLFFRVSRSFLFTGQRTRTIPSFRKKIVAKPDLCIRYIFPKSAENKQEKKEKEKSSIRKQRLGEGERKKERRILLF